ncbi:extracellular solute-binding protein [Undibacterium parvum]|uniref:Putrescine-binding periplasmic protein n=1 Tax=Undibacterium parvum TaxID=401471 RepID=A0A3Q9BQ33_9BURK|nr:extracellular solute-binding protein [Undibacterium parvum]AZP11849.1 extracellular solute-binding protein [Undibacterium parvum]
MKSTISRPALRARLRVNSAPTLSKLLLASIFGLVTSLAQAALPQEEKILYVYNWSDYIAEDTVSNFEKETGIKVRYDTMDSSETLHAKLVAGKTGYDVVVTSTEWASIQIKGGLLMKLDKSKLTNLVNMDPVMLAAMAKADPGNAYLTSWLWGFETIGINTKKVKEALGDLPMPDNPMELIFNPKYISRLKSCGVSVLDAPSTVIPVFLQYLGRNPFSNNSGDYQDVNARLKEIRPYISLFSSSGYINNLASGSLCAVLGYSGDINIARQRAIDSKNGNEILALMPNATVSFMDNMAIPIDAPHPGNALLWMNYIMRPEVHASLTNKVFYANTNLSSVKFVNKEVSENKTVFVSDADKKKFAAAEAVNGDIRRIRTRIYTQFKTGL